MSAKVRFDEVLDALEDLPIDQQFELLEIVRRRLAERGRQRVIREMQEAEAEFSAGNAQRTTADDLLREIDS